MIFNADLKIVFIIITQIVPTSKMEEDAFNISEGALSVHISLKKMNAPKLINVHGMEGAEIYCIIFCNVDVLI
jgi:hypothetical protein